MKKVFLSILMASCICVALNSCSNGDYNADPTGNSGQTNPIYNPGGSSTGGTSTGGIALGTFTATIDGSSFSASLPISGLTQGSLIIAGTTGTVNTSNFKSLTLGIFNYTGAGTYDLAAGVAEITYVNASTSSTIEIDTGQIIITSDNSTSYQGTFNGTGNGVTITNGKFNVKK